MIVVVKSFEGERAVFFFNLQNSKFVGSHIVGKNGHKEEKIRILRDLETRLGYYFKMS